MTPGHSGHLDRTPALQTGQWTHQLQLYCTVAILYSGSGHVPTGDLYSGKRTVNLIQLGIFI